VLADAEWRGCEWFVCTCRGVECEGREESEQM
jgi:hypothetical protein